MILLALGCADPAPGDSGGTASTPVAEDFVAACTPGEVVPAGGTTMVLVSMEDQLAYRPDPAALQDGGELFLSCPSCGTPDELHPWSRTASGYHAHLAYVGDGAYTPGSTTRIGQCPTDLPSPAVLAARVILAGESLCLWAEGGPLALVDCAGFPTGETGE